MSGFRPWLFLLALIVQACALSRALSRSSMDVSVEMAQMRQQQQQIAAIRAACAEAWNQREFSPEEKVRLSDGTLHRWLGLSADAGVSLHGDERLTRVAKAVTPPAHLQTFSFSVVDASVADAVSLLDGRVVVTSELLHQVSSDGQLAGAVAHEAAHLVHGDALEVARKLGRNKCEAIEASRVASPSLQGRDGGELATALGPAIDELYENVVSKFIGAKRQGGADADLAADRTAASWMHAAGYDVRDLEAVLEKLPPPTDLEAKIAARVEALEAHRQTLPPLPLPKKKLKK
jgi:predicted Zn-dependent protease